LPQWQAKAKLCRDTKHMGFFSDSKDRMVESMALPMLNNSLLQPYGKATSLKLNSADKSAAVVLDLKGENHPVEIQLTRYELQREGERVFLIVHSVTTSREWLTTLAREHLLNKKLELPPQVAAYAGRLL
jgi:hypothetical protein